MLRKYLLLSTNELSRPLSFDELVHMLDRCKDMGSLSIRNKVINFRYLKKYEVMDNITKLMRLSNYAFVHKNIFCS